MAQKPQTYSIQQAFQFLMVFHQIDDCATNQVDHEVEQVVPTQMELLL